MGNENGDEATTSLAAAQETDTKVLEVLRIVFGIVVGSGFDTLLDFEGKSQEQQLVGALLYWMGISVVARLSLGGALHLHIEYGPKSTWTDAMTRRRALFWDIAFYVAFALILRYAAALGTSVPPAQSEQHKWFGAVPFFAGQVILFSIALSWGCFSKRVVKKPPQRGDWSFWTKIDAWNLVVAALALCLLHVAGFAKETNRLLYLLVIAAFLYGAIGVWELRCLLAAADNAGTARPAAKSRAVRASSQ